LFAHGVANLFAATVKYLVPACVLPLPCYPAHRFNKAVEDIRRFPDMPRDKLDKITLCLILACWPHYVKT